MAKSLASYPGVDHQNLRAILQKVQAWLCDQVLNSGGLTIGSGDKKKIKIANDVYFMYDGAPVKITAAELTLTTSNNVANAKFNLLSVLADSAGTVTVVNGTEGATLGAVVPATVPEGSRLLGYVVINPTGTGGFVGGTTELDDGTVVPNAVYLNAINHNVSHLTW